MSEFKSKYEVVMEDLKRAGKVKNLSAAENKAVAQELTAGVDRFLMDQNRKSKQAQKAIANICLNS